MCQAGCCIFPAGWRWRPRPPPGSPVSSSRSVAGHIALGSRARLEQLALACSLAQQAGVPSPAVLLLGEMPGETLVLVTATPGGDHPDSGRPDGAASIRGAAALFSSLRALHRAGIAHHDLRPENLFISADRAGFCSLDAAVPAAAYLLAFIAALRAVGAHPAILPAAVVYLAGNAVGSAAPTPGGLGAVEAVLAAGLTAIGVPAHEAIPAVLVFRLATFWLPIPAGWVSYLLLQRRGVL
ncbi:MAG TPA: flippase-like domain-containing protein [Streptosporangiaceae bacterium]|jgi:hypothetical protein|nr:flippase-like domain-containing protein [Streptosporangiaceae bacterium]